MLINVINPATEMVVAELPSTQDPSALYHKLRTRQPDWALTPLPERLAIVEKFYHLLDSEKEALALTLTHETGKPLWQAFNELKGARERIEFFLEKSAAYLAEETVFDGEWTEKIVYEPLGVIGNISAWNYPYLVGLNVFVPALIAGNAVAYKPSEFALMTGLKIKELWDKAGLPEGIFEVFVGDKEIGKKILNLPLDGFYFTGSYQTGKFIHEQTAQYLVPTQLELGGKDPIYVSQYNNDIQKVAEAVADGAFYNNGQSCCAVERIYVHKDVYDEFLESFVETVRNFRVGNPMLEDTYIGPLTREAQLDVMESQLADAIRKGAKIQCGGQRVKGKGYFFEPTVLTNVNHEMLLMKEETFGPMIGVQSVESKDEALKLMQDTVYGLTAGVYTNDQQEAEDVLKHINCGSVYLNCCDRVNARLPWSGRGHSGLGYTLSHLGIRAFVQPKAYHLKSPL
ncbi:aldehyde dehydrogenase family protein [Limibacter armeniacum]|uniref:aldehyde dehydrogenase family protein n=1 Tax=Limibacter armeniacum TaxID=466084 RepID=UPI002FE652C8